MVAFGAGVGVADEATPVPEVWPGVLERYLPKEAIPDSAILSPPPPAVASAAAALDQEGARANLALRDTDRWRLAVMDANLKSPEAAGAFPCALGARSPKRTRHGSISCCVAS